MAAEWFWRRPSIGLRDTRPSSSIAHSASSCPVESDEMQLGKEMELDVTESTESVRGPSPQRQEEEAVSYTLMYVVNEL